jgi:hypothetical protein
MPLCPGGYNGAKEGYEIPAGTDIFLSVRWTVVRFRIVIKAILVSYLSLFHDLRKLLVL